MDLVEAAKGPDRLVRHPWETARLDVVRRLIAAHVDLRPGSAVLDIGCGDAFVATALAADFPQTQFFGVDSGLTAALIEGFRAAGRANVQLFQDLDAAARALGRPATLVLMMDVLEHIEDDHGFLEHLVALPVVNRDTRMLITVPAFQGLYSAHDVFLKHYRRYSNATLRATLERGGLEVAEIGYFFASLLPLRLLKVLKERAFGASGDEAGVAATSVPPGAALLRRLLVVDASMGQSLKRLGVTLPGLSNYAICRPSA